MTIDRKQYEVSELLTALKGLAPKEHQQLVNSFYAQTKDVMAEILK